MQLFIVKIIKSPLNLVTCKFFIGLYSYVEIGVMLTNLYPEQGTCANCDNVIRSTPVKCETSSGRRRELCSNECLKAWAKKEKEKENVEVEEEVGIASSSFSSMTTPPSSMSPSSGNGVSPSDKALDGMEVAAGRKGRLEAVC